MNQADVAELLAIRQVLWPHTPQQQGDLAMVEIRTWHALLGGFEKETVLAAMRSKRAEAFPPTVGQLEEAIRPTPTYATALEEFARMRASGYSPLYTRPEDVPWSHPLIEAFASAGHWQAWGLSPDGSADGDLVQAEAAFRAHMRESFKGVQIRWAARNEIAGGGRGELAAGRQITEGSSDE